ncbi:hypothetical protein [Streptomyces sp. fd1-xmd]|uniref:hypothetical protein n=1 Tax=Streptomyces sp. fd1-xmd TaxID=1812480 RepID=UPI001CED77D7|nr:hypothetical protein [Streptomyces sp. fd1-xmd]
MAATPCWRVSAVVGSTVVRPVRGSTTASRSLSKAGNSVFNGFFWALVHFLWGLTDSDVRGVWSDGRTLSLIRREALVTSLYPSLTRALAEALVDVLRYIDGSEDEQMDQDDAVKVMEGVGHVVRTLSSDQRQELIELVGEMAVAENNPARREFLEASPEGFGLIEDAS